MDRGLGEKGSLNQERTMRRGQEGHRDGKDWSEAESVL